MMDSIGAALRSVLDVEREKNNRHWAEQRRKQVEEVDAMVSKGTPRFKALGIAGITRAMYDRAKGYLTRQTKGAEEVGSKKTWKSWKHLDSWTDEQKIGAVKQVDELRAAGAHYKDAIKRAGIQETRYELWRKRWPSGVEGLVTRKRNGATPEQLHKCAEVRDLVAKGMTAHQALAQVGGLKDGSYYYYEKHYKRQIGGIQAANHRYGAGGAGRKKAEKKKAMVVRAEAVVANGTRPATVSNLVDAYLTKGGEDPVGFAALLGREFGLE
jgi:uncharacterized protein YoaH (UPF0181 family)